MSRLIFLIAILLTTLPVRAQDGAGIYLRGEHISATLMDGKLSVPGDRFACGGCHGTDAAGGSEGGREFPPLDWGHLSDPQRDGGAYDEALFARALRDGIGANGKILAGAMPRYSLNDTQLAALIGFLRQVDADQRRGILPGSVTIGVGKIGADEAAGLSLAAEVFNQAGGAFGRQILLQKADNGDAFIDIDTDTLAILLNPRINGEQHRLADEAGSDDAQIVMLDQIGLDPSNHNIRLISLTPSHAAPAIAAELPAAGLRAYLHGLLLSEALIACGRSLRRTCVENSLTKVDIAKFLHIYDFNDPG